MIEKNAFLIKLDSSFLVGQENTYAKQRNLLLYTYSFGFLTKFYIRIKQYREKLVIFYFDMVRSSRLQACNFTKNRLQHMCFPVKFHVFSCWALKFCLVLLYQIGKTIQNSLHSSVGDGLLLPKLLQRYIK